MTTIATIAVTLDKGKLLEKLKSNRDKHESDFDKAMKNWREEVSEEAEKVVAEAKEGSLSGMQTDRKRGFTGHSHPLINAIFDEPKSHLTEYSTVIDMLEMCEDETIHLHHGQFRCYVEDNWEWKQDWLLSNSKYLG